MAFTKKNYVDLTGLSTFKTSLLGTVINDTNKTTTNKTATIKAIADYVDSEVADLSSAVTTELAKKVSSVTYDSTNKKLVYNKGGSTNTDIVTVATLKSAIGIFVKSGSSASAGLVPAPSTTAGTSKYLREDGTWATPLSVSVATKDTLGLVKSSTTGTTSNRNYVVEVNSDGTMKVNVPWTNTTSVSATTTGNGNAVTSITASGSTISVTKGATFLTSHQDISGKENTSNKVKSWSSTTTDDHYPSEKLVKTALDGKYAKPSGGIPKSDLASAVQTSLGKADTALQEHQDISGKENTSNKVKSWSSTTTDDHYPSEKLVKDSLDSINSAITNFDYRGRANTWSAVNTFSNGTDVTSASSTASGAIIASNGGIWAAGGIRGNKVYNAVWNDLADCIPVDKDCELTPGYCYCFDGEKYYKSSKYLDDGIIGIHSDTYGMHMGYKDNCKQMDVAVAGFVLAYVDKEYPAGTPLTCTENGYLTKIEKSDKIEYPEKIVATYWKNESSEYWGGEKDKIKVNGRKWVKIK